MFPKEPWSIATRSRTRTLLMKVASARDTSCGACSGWGCTACETAKPGERASATPPTTYTERQALSQHRAKSGGEGGATGACARGGGRSSRRIGSGGIQLLRARAASLARAHPGTLFVPPCVSITDTRESLLGFRRVPSLSRARLPGPARPSARQARWHASPTRATFSWASTACCQDRAGGQGVGGRGKDDGEDGEAWRGQWRQGGEAPAVCLCASLAIRHKYAQGVGEVISTNDGRGGERRGE